MSVLKSLALRSVFIVVLFISSFAGFAPQTSDPTATLARPSTIKILKALGGYPCPDDSAFTCVTIEVPLDHFNPADTRTIPVTFAVLPAQRARLGMFVTVTGGPGTSGIYVADSYTSGFQKPLVNNFDIVFFDQRGVGLSGGLDCPEAATEYYSVDAQTETPEQRAAFAEAGATFAENCVQEMGNSELLPYLGTEQAIEDLEYFRTLMKDDKFWLYGESYGTQYAQTYAAKYGEHLNGLILDGTVDLTLTGFEYYAQQAQAFNDTLTATLEACDADPICMEDIGGSAVEAYDALAEALETGPIPYNFPLPAGGFEERFFTLTDLEVVAAGQVYGESDRMMFNRSLASSAAYEDLTPLARLLYLNLGVDPQTLDVIPDPSFSTGIFYAVECQDYGYPGSTPQERAENFFEAGEQVVPFIPRLGSLFYGDLPCAFWPNAADDLTRPEPFAAEGIPTLVLNAEADPATPIGNALSVYSRLENGFLIVQEGGPHVIFGYGNPCPDDIVTDFIVNGTLPEEQVTECPGVIADEYVPVSPTDASEFVDLLDALSWMETEISYLPEYYYWDGFTPTQAGCALGGTLAFESTGARYLYTFDQCAVANDFIMSGTGSYHLTPDRFVLSISTEGRWDCTIKYTRTGENTTLTGKCDGKPIKVNGKSTSPAHDKLLIPQAPADK